VGAGTPTAHPPRARTLNALRDTEPMPPARTPDLTRPTASYAHYRRVGSSADIHAHAEFTTDVLVVRGSVAM
jgi:hypothetical protein